MTSLDFLCVVASFLLFLAAYVVRPDHARCGRGWYVNGVSPGGVFECRLAPTGDPERDGWRGGPDATIDHPGWLRSRVYCTGGAHPILVLTDREARSVGCQR